jgi:hypothetical protein
MFGGQRYAPTHVISSHDIETDIAALARIQSETNHRLDIFARRFNEGRDVMAASEYTRWLLGSGILTLLESNANGCTGPLKIDGSFLRWKACQLLDACNDRFRTGDEKPTFDNQEYQSLHEKLDCMASYLSRLSTAPAILVAAVPATEVQKISEESEEQPAAVMPRFDHSLVLLKDSLNRVLLPNVFCFAFRTNDEVRIHKAISWLVVAG